MHMRGLGNHGLCVLDKIEKSVKHAGIEKAERV